MNKLSVIYPQETGGLSEAAAKKHAAESLEKTRQNRRTAAAIDKFGCWNCARFERCEKIECRRATERAPGGEI